MDYYVGQSVSIFKQFSDADIRVFAEVSGDDNPVHLDEGFAKKTVFGRRIVHGILTASLVSAVLGTKLPGYGTIYLSQSLNFRKPVFLGDTVETTVTILSVVVEKRLIELETVCKNQDGDIVLEGKALVKAPKQSL